MLKRSAQWLVRMAAGTVLVLALCAAYLIIQDRATLSRLGQPGANPKTTEVYSAWLELQLDQPCTWERALAWLEAVGYHCAPGMPHQPGDYRADYPLLTVFTRPYRYPDKDYPAQLLELRFGGGGLDRLTAFAGHAALAEWRLEPRVLAVWDSGAKTARVQVRLSDLPPYVPRAILAIEDKRFFRHGAFDATGIARALWVDLRHGSLRQGASTLSQQLARSIFLDVHRTWRRKALEAALAIYLEMRYSKPQLLEMYLNQVYWGQDGSRPLLGVEAAGQAFFGKPAAAISVGESATLAGMLQSPGRYSSRAPSETLRERRTIVLGLMRDQRVITENQYAAAMGETIRFASPRKSEEAAYFLAALRDQLSERYVWPVFLAQGYRIYTTLDPLLQHAAVDVMGSSALFRSGHGRGKAETPQAALTVIDPLSGAILAWVGGTNFATNPFDHVVYAKRQPGSAFKPFVALAALETGKITTATLLEDKPLRLKGSRGDWRPQNYDRRYRGSVSLWDAVVNSLNVPMVRLAMQTGIARVIDAAHRAGIQSPLREDLSLALGASEVSLLELTGAYATVASGGWRNDPFSIQAILGPEGAVLESHRPSAQSIFPPELAYLITEMLQAVLDVGTAKAARLLGFTAPAAGKTGTSENFQDAWFEGYTPRIVCGVWVGYDIPKSLGRSAAGIALPLWTAFMNKAAALEPRQEFSKPEGLVWKSIDPESGLLAKTGCPRRRKAAFLPGTAPTGDCALHPGGLMGFLKRLAAKPAMPK